MSRILIIEDEENLANFVNLELKHEGYETDVELDGRAGLDAALNQDFDVILLDLMLPELNGIEVARRVRELKDTPIIIMTARDSVIDRVSGLDHGADDYIVKPFAIEELLARVRALLRRISIEDGNNKEHQTTVNYKDLTIEKENRVVRRGDEVINLTKREYELLLILMETSTWSCPGRSCSARSGVTIRRWKRTSLTSTSVTCETRSTARARRATFKPSGEPATLFVRKVRDDLWRIRRKANNLFRCA